MNILKDILYGVSILEVQGDRNTEVNAIQIDSRSVNEGDLFIAVKGLTVDGHQFISSAIENGATCIVCEEIDADLIQDSVAFVKVENAQKAIGKIAANFYDNPSAELNLIGITGTNGKTSCVTLLHQLFTKLGYMVGMLSTVENKIGNEIIPSTHTTPNPVALNALLREMVDAGCEHCFMEVSSHAVVQYRIEGLQFKGAAFTNITHDHLDYHGTFKEYIKAKKAFFDDLSSDSFALVNTDDSNGMVMLQNTKAAKRTYAVNSLADYSGKIMENTFQGLLLQVNQQELWVKLIGKFNAYNILTTYGIACELGESQLEILTILSDLEPAEGRFQFFKSQTEVTAIVDYAHTPDALKNVLVTIEELRTKNEKVIVVVGCGGDRDKTKRPLMAGISTKYGDQIIITSDNPRTENPTEIINDMLEGVEITARPKTLTIESRLDAIKTACAIAQPKDIVLIAGKGHEKYQDINGVKSSFDDFKIVSETLKNLQK